VIKIRMEDLMFKRFLLGMIAASALALFWSEANAQECLRWRNVGGSETCLRWSTGSIILEATFKQDCGVNGANCSAFVDADTMNSVVFCRNTTTNAIRKSTTRCTATILFGGSADQCEPKHEQDGTTDNGVGHEAGHKCTSTTAFAAQNPTACNTSCNIAGGEVVHDIVPVEMDTTVFLSVGGEASFAPAEAGGANECPSGSSFCEVDQHCSIDPNKIQFGKIRQYKCDITFAGGGGGE
jgi:hypothetical protein